jgi:hypothetical protein
MSVVDIEDDPMTTITTATETPTTGLSLPSSRC